jgi:hypothetical protein
VTVPFVREWFRRDIASTRTFFQWCERDSWFVQAVTQELRELHLLPSHGVYPWALIEAAARAIAGDMIAVGTELPSDVAVRFDQVDVFDRHGLRRVWFPGEDIAERFLAGVLAVDGNRKACIAALEHHKRHALGGGDPQPRRASDSGIPAHEDAVLARRIGSLLFTRRLALLPVDPARRILRLAWVEHESPVGVTASSPSSPVRSAPVPLTPRAQPRFTLASILPEPPPSLSPQALILIEAAKHGVPFCEECARQAAELAGV